MGESKFRDAVVLDRRPFKPNVALMKRLRDAASDEPKGEWTRFEVPRCDLCNRIARWRHPAGGYRCNKCPRPAK